MPGWKAPVGYRYSPVLTGTPEAFTIASGIGLLTEAPADPGTWAMAVTVGGSSRTRVTTSPAAGQYRVRSLSVTGGTMYLPILDFHSSDEGLSGTCSYYRVGTIPTRELFRQLVVFLRPLTGLASSAALPPATTDINTRGYPGDVAFLTDGTLYISNGTTWTSPGA